MVESVIREIQAQKEASGEVLTFVTSLEVSQRLHIPISQVEIQAKEIPGIHVGRTINYQYYYF